MFIFTMDRRRVYLLQQDLVVLVYIEQVISDVVYRSDNQ